MLLLPKLLLLLEMLLLLKILLLWVIFDPSLRRGPLAEDQFGGRIVELRNVELVAEIAEPKRSCLEGTKPYMDQDLG